MPYFPDNAEMPKNEDEFHDRLMAAFDEGIRQGRQQGAQEQADKVNEWVKLRYFDPQVVRKTKFAEEILELAKDLIHELREGSLRLVPEVRERKRPNRPRRGGN